MTGRTSDRNFIKRHTGGRYPPRDLDELESFTGPGEKGRARVAIAGWRGISGRIVSLDAGERIRRDRLATIHGQVESGSRPIFENFEASNAAVVRTSRLIGNRAGL